MELVGPNGPPVYLGMVANSSRKRCPALPRKATFPIDRFPPIHTAPKLETPHLRSASPPSNTTSKPKLARENPFNHRRIFPHRQVRVEQVHRHNVAKVARRRGLPHQ